MNNVQINSSVRFEVLKRLFLKFHILRCYIVSNCKQLCLLAACDRIWCQDFRKLWMVLWSLHHRRKCRELDSLAVLFNRYVNLQTSQNGLPSVRFEFSHWCCHRFGPSGILCFVVLTQQLLTVYQLTWHHIQRTSILFFFISLSPPPTLEEREMCNECQI
jgi:hypothetical protein